MGLGPHNWYFYQCLSRVALFQMSSARQRKADQERSRSSLGTLGMRIRSTVINSVTDILRGIGGAPHQDTGRFDGELERTGDGNGFASAGAAAQAVACGAAL